MIGSCFFLSLYFDLKYMTMQSKGEFIISHCRILENDGVGD